MRLSIFLALLACTIRAGAQYFNSAAGCQLNVNQGVLWTDARADIRDATFKIEFVGAGAGDCTGTLINRNTSDGSLDYYFLIARHCVKDIDFNATHNLMFNYQSPDANTMSTALSNRGSQSSQSSNITSMNGYEYIHKTKIDLIAWYFWGDFALCRMQTPIPPHFNVYYAGWNPSQFLPTGGIGAPNFNFCPPGINSIVTVHHSQADIKKISGTNSIQVLSTPIADGCVTITTIIDWLFGWIWHHSVSTQVICNYVDNPWYVVPSWCSGAIEEGASGSGIFNSNNRYFGTLSGSVGTCNPSTTYGKFKNVYPNASVKNVLNPPNDFLTDLTGMDGRRISCWPNLSLPGVPGASGEYFPASHYQALNKIHLQATNNITTNARIFIYSGANYEFSAGNQIELLNNFSVEQGAEFTGIINGCYYNGISSARAASPEQVLIDRIRDIDLPKVKKFDAERFKAQNPQVRHELSIFPNPSNGVFTISGNVSEDDLQVTVKDVTGKLVYQNTLPGQQDTKMDLQSLEDGAYIMVVKNKTGSQNFKLIIQK